MRNPNSPRPQGESACPSSAGSGKEFDDAGVHLIAGDEQLADRDGQLEAARAGAARVDVQDAVAGFDPGLVRMPELTFDMSSLSRQRMDKHFLPVAWGC